EPRCGWQGATPERLSGSGLRGGGARTRYRRALVDLRRGVLQLGGGAWRARFGRLRRRRAVLRDARHRSRRGRPDLAGGGRSRLLVSCRAQHPVWTMSGAAPCLMVQGTASGVGKSLLAAALCRILARAGHRVPPLTSEHIAPTAAGP